MVLNLVSFFNSETRSLSAKVLFGFCKTLILFNFLISSIILDFFNAMAIFSLSKFLLKPMLINLGSLILIYSFTEFANFGSNVMLPG